MKLIGIYLRRGTDPSVRKNLKEEKWYPFVQAYTHAPQNQTDYENMSSKDNSVNVYHIHRDLPSEINVCCIVGKNGSGKSTLLDILYRILNNFSITLLQRIDGVDCEMSYAKGLNADLYYELKRGQVGKITCKDNEIDYFNGFDSDGKWKNKYIRGLVTQSKEILSSFFYTISTNYSVYSLCKVDYDPYNSYRDYQRKINGDWIHGLFNKNDGYLSPIALSPYRNDDAVDVVRERNLAYQRLTALTLYFFSKGKKFIEGYNADKLSYSFNYQYKETAIKKLVESLGYSGIDKNLTIKYLSLFDEYWKTKIGSKVSEKAADNSPAFDIIIYYLSSKCLKICNTYPTFRFVYNPIDYKNNFDDKIEEQREKIAKAIELMLSPEEATHITLKLRRCLKFINDDTYTIWDNDGLECAKVFGNRRFSSYDDAALCLPPSFFEYELSFKRGRSSKKSSMKFSNKKTVTFSQMSSGEQQFLFSVSHILYHLKNIQSVKYDKFRIPYHHINLILDEVELYFHPEYQRKYIRMLMDMLARADVDKRSIYSINILLATHSPFILSDVQVNNILYLKDGMPKKQAKETFGANLYDMMKDSFFFTENAYGSIASDVIEGIIQKANTGKQQNIDLVGIVGDRMIHQYVEYQMALRDVQDRDK